MQEVINRFLIPKFIELGMNATGEWLSNLESQARENTGVIRGRDYSYYLANGRGPGGRPPIPMIERWVNAKLGISGSEGLGVAFAVANKIANEGTSWYPSGSDLIEVLNSPEVVDFVRSELAYLFRAEAKLEIQRTIKEMMV